MTSVITHFKSVSFNSEADTLNVWCKNCRMWQLLQTITETINTLFPIVNFLKCVVTACFQLLPYDIDISLGSVVTHLRCDGIFIDSIITNFLPILTGKKFESWSIFDELQGIQKVCQIIWANLYIFLYILQDSFFLILLAFLALSSVARPAVLQWRGGCSGGLEQSPLWSPGHSPRSGGRGFLLLKLNAFYPWNDHGPCLIISSLLWS